MNLKESKIKQPKPNYAELEKLAKKQGVKAFSFDEAVGEGSKLWTGEEFNKFDKWLKDTRINDTIRENSNLNI